MQNEELIAFVKQCKERLLEPVLTETLELIHQRQSARGNSVPVVEREISKNNGYMNALNDMIKMCEQHANNTTNK